MTSFVFQEGLALVSIVMGVIEARRKNYRGSMALIGIGLALAVSAALTRFAGL